MTALSIRTASISRSISVSSPTASSSVPAMLHTTKRSFHTSRVIRNAIMMPAMSPLMTEGAITRWFKREGEAFKAGEAILEIESDIYRISVEAENPGIMGRILVPAGTEHVPVEQVLALVNKGEDTQSLQSRRHDAHIERAQSLHLASQVRSHIRSASVPQPGTSSPQTQTTSSRSTPQRSHTHPQTSSHSPQTPSFFANGNPPRPRSPTLPSVHMLHNASAAPSGMKHSRDMHSSSSSARPASGAPEQVKDVQNAAADVRRKIVSNLMSTGATARGNYFDSLL
ncbi:hypothetical protein EYR40_001387 [Pleurotus pulmonarius]|nr:hypothetical protein EYR38_004626 [Pleurotus pulmonarius]KAF4609034.1 hypothetical protein EYR40_001387 [Pleurotus pulmonarius]